MAGEESIWALSKALIDVLSEALTVDIEGAVALGQKVYGLASETAPRPSAGWFSATEAVVSMLADLADERGAARRAWAADATRVIVEGLDARGEHVRETIEVPAGAAEAVGTIRFACGAEQTCEGCGEGFVPTRRHMRYCAKRCYHRAIRASRRQEVKR